jgi:hypothetical protein
MVKCSSCGFDNREAKVCGKCGRSIQVCVALSFCYVLQYINEKRLSKSNRFSRF